MIKPVVSKITSDGAQLEYKYSFIYIVSTKEFNGALSDIFPTGKIQIDVVFQEVEAGFVQKQTARYPSYSFVGNITVQRVVYPFDTKSMFMNGVKGISEIAVKQIFYTILYLPEFHISFWPEAKIKGPVIKIWIERTGYSVTVGDIIVNPSMYKNIKRIILHT